MEGRLLTVKVPQRLELAPLIPSHYRKDKRENLLDAMCYIVSLCLPDILNKHKYEELQEDGFTYLCGSLLCKIVGTDYSTALSILLDNNILTKNNYYLAGGHCKGYRLNTQYYTESKDHAIKSRGLKKRLLDHYKESEKEQAKRLKNISHLTQWLKPAHLKIDINAAHNYIEFYRAGLIHKLNKSTFTNTLQYNEARQRILYRTEQMKLISRTIYDGQFKFSRDDAGRLYTPLTAIKKELRNFVAIDGRETGYVDITASQPYLFQVLLKPSFWQTTGAPLSMYRINKSLYNELNNAKIIKQVIHFLSSLKHKYGKDLQALPFKKIAWENDFYNHLSEQIKRASKSFSYFSSRDQTKQTMMLLLYDVYTKKQPAYYKIFKQLYPEEVKLMDIIKQAGKSELPKILQAVEAELVLDIVGKAISSLYASDPFYTVHDSVIMEVDKLDLLSGILKDELTKAVGTIPGLKIVKLHREKPVIHLAENIENDWSKIYTDVTQTNAKLWMPAEAIIAKEVPLLYELPALNDKRLYSTRFINTLADGNEE